eukprot:scpid88689/ scgid29179/ Aurora kinase A; Aurora 2; Aurora/IPL1-related kinase 1; Breast tumor-amplified kinase; Serine/threonine-protein kinase 15; Serine/threonine-protein kinase 6; Serine/threonine-protein kinase aurora-A
MLAVPWPKPLSEAVFGEDVGYEPFRRRLAKAVEVDFMDVGRGQFGKVFGVEIPATKKGTVVGKFLDHTSRQPNLEQMVCNELTISTKLQHKNIAACFGGMQSALWPVIFFEWIRGRTLEEMLNDSIKTTGAPLTEQTLRPITGQLLEALHYLQTARVFHGDLKSDNVVVREDGTPKIIDFGLAVEYTAERKAMVIHPRMYTHPPEMNDKEMGGVDHKSVMFFLGAMVYKVAVGQNGYVGEFYELNVEEQNGRLRVGVDKSAENYQRLSPDLQDLIVWMTRYEPCERPDAAHALQSPWFTAEPGFTMPTLVNYQPQITPDQDTDILTKMARDLDMPEDKLAEQIMWRKNTWQSIAYRANVHAALYAPAQE